MFIYDDIMRLPNVVGMWGGHDRNKHTRRWSSNDIQGVQSPNKVCAKSTAQYSKAHKSCWVFVGLASNPNVHVLYSKLA